MNDPGLNDSSWGFSGSGESKLASEYPSNIHQISIKYPRNILEMHRNAWFEIFAFLLWGRGCRFFLPLWLRGAGSAYWIGKSLEFGHRSQLWTFRWRWGRRCLRCILRCQPQFWLQVTAARHEMRKARFASTHSRLTYRFPVITEGDSVSLSGSLPDYISVFLADCCQNLSGFLSTFRFADWD